jgi:hypothetical protein
MSDDARSSARGAGRRRVEIPRIDIMVGFGQAGVTRDGVFVWSEGPRDDVPDCWTLRDAECAAASDPDHDWRVVLDRALSRAVYQRQDTGRWVLVETGRGFA